MSQPATGDRGSLDALALLVDGVLTLTTAGWTVFWLNIVRLHLATDAYADAAATVVLLIGPMLVLLAWRLAGRAGVLDALASPGAASGS